MTAPSLVVRPRDDEEKGDASRESAVKVAGARIRTTLVNSSHSGGFLRLEVQYVQYVLLLCKCTWLSGRVTLATLSESSGLRAAAAAGCWGPLGCCRCWLLERESCCCCCGFLFVAPLPARRLLSREGDLAQTKAWKEETVKTPRRFSVCFVDCVT